MTSMLVSRIQVLGGMMKKNIFMTFDMDWASDEVLRDFYDLIVELDICGTLNVTHDTKLLDFFRKDGTLGGGRLELGIHPNYNRLLVGDDSDQNYLNVLKNIKEIEPGAITIRSHALTSSSIIVSRYKDFGIRYDLNTLIPAYKGLCIKPYTAPADESVLVLPFIFEDDIYLSQEEQQAPAFFLSDEFEAPRIFNFHPIHLFLNTDQISTYEHARPYFGDSIMLKTCINKEHFGIRDFLLKLVFVARKDGWSFKKICEGEWE